MSRSTRPAFSIKRLRALIILALCVGLTVFTATVLRQLASLDGHFGPEVRADLAWRAVRGASELARTADLGVAMGDRAMVEQAFAPHAASHDVLAIVALDANGTVIAQSQAFAPVQLLFASRPGTVLDGPGYVSSWAPVVIEGAEVGKVAIAVSTNRLADTHETLTTVSKITLVSGILILAFGIVIIWFFTRAVQNRDAQLNDHAANLERRVDERTRELDERNRGMRVVLDNVAQGFITIDSDGRMSAERSAIVDTWFGHRTGTLSQLVGGDAPEFAAWLDASLDMIRDGFMPLEVCLSQLPPSFVAKGRSFAVTYSPIMDGETLRRLLVIISDVTEQLARERAERDQRELITVFQRVGSDRAACEEFLDEAQAMIDGLRSTGDRIEQDRALHTLKGNAGMFGFEAFAELCHEIESELRETHECVTPEQFTRIAAAWDHVVSTLRSLLGDSSRDIVQLDRRELEAALERARAGAPTGELGKLLASWTDEPVARRFERLGQQATLLAKRLGKGQLAISIADNGVRLDHHWAPLWSTLVHVVRNAVDHGIESPEERHRAGKTSARLMFSARRTDRELTIEIEDDGNGVNWDAIRGKAQRLGLPATSQRELVDAMFADGLSTRETATNTSGRGIGLSAVKSVVQAMGGSIDVLSTEGRGARFQLRFPAPRFTMSRTARIALHP